MYEVGDTATLGMPLVMVEVEGSTEGDPRGSGCGDIAWGQMWYVQWNLRVTYPLVNAVCNLKCS